MKSTQAETTTTREAAWTTYDGLPAVVTLTQTPQGPRRRCLVGVPEGHACYGLGLEDLSFPDAASIPRELSITSESLRPEEERTLSPDYWWFGFETEGAQEGVPYCVVHCERLAAALKGSYHRRYTDKKVYNLNNYTPHPINIYNHEGHQVMEIPPIGEITRVTWDIEDKGWIWVASINGVPLPKPQKVPVTHRTYNSIHQVPLEDPVSINITSTMVRDRLETLDEYSHRSDIACPGPLLRDEEGGIYGCTGLNYGGQP